MNSIMIDEIRGRLSTKLGRCPICIRRSALGTVFSWTAVGLLALVRVEWIVLLGAIAAALGFTALTGAHLLTFTLRALRPGRERGGVDRREFLVSFAKVASVVFVASIGVKVFQKKAFGAPGDPENSFCAALCNAVFRPGVARGRCKSEGAQGHGICFEGSCLPSPQASEGLKPKIDPRTTLQTFLARNPIPSTLGGIFFHLARRFQRGDVPANELEEATFPLFARLQPDVQPILGCAVNRFEALSKDERTRLFGSMFADSGFEPLSIEALRSPIASEIAARHGVCLVETPGLVRPIEFFDPIEGTTVVAPVPWISRLSGRRTAEFIPEGGSRLSLEDYTGDELERFCFLDAGGSVLCDFQVAPCPGDDVEGTCLRVPNFGPGSTVRLEGFNFFNVEARVLLDAITTPLLREVDAHVCGDTETPLTEMVGGVGKVIGDSRVRDFLTFEIPQDLPEGLYRVSVIAPNNTGEYPDTPEFIEDVVALRKEEAEEMVSIGFPAPPRQTSLTANGIHIDIRPCEPGPGQPECSGPAKTEGQYRELRSYRAEDQFSNYRITLRYNRIETGPPD